MTETGAIETLEGPFFKKGDNYYTQEMGKANWIPFAQYDYVEVDLPSNATNIENSTADSENNKFCTSCGNELEEGDKFCAECGTEVKK